ncbi:hypothetical protein T484DRAFT_3630808 [Baffinella frigidus]|nr:hypothetical protein T484DRAFT_3630808 [Cryptophyta sp. CCMP2293]
MDLVSWMDEATQKQGAQKQRVQAQEGEGPPHDADQGLPATPPQQIRATRFSEGQEEMTSPAAQWKPWQETPSPVHRRRSMAAGSNDWDTRADPDVGALFKFTSMVTGFFDGAAHETLVRPETLNPKQSTPTLNPKPETRNPEPETRNPKPETFSPQP